MEDRVLPVDVLIEILVDLPIKSLMRFRCVSKGWCALINSPNFVTTHLKRDGKEAVLMERQIPGGQVFSFHDADSLDLLVAPNLSIPQFSNDLISGKNSYIGTCNGLVCLALTERIVLCNPTLGESELLPPTPFAFPENHDVFLCATRFGFDAFTNAYKIAQIWELIDMRKVYPQNCFEPLVRIDLYNCSTNSWKVIDAVIPRITNYHNFDVFFNGACHWHGWDVDADSLNILSLDLNTEVFQQFDYPREGKSFDTVVVLNQCLSILLSDLRSVDIWVMKEYGVKESWTKEFVIGPFDTTIYPISLLKDEWLLVLINKQLASCALYGNEIKRFHVHQTNEPMRALIFKESLISLKQVISCPKKD